MNTAVDELIADIARFPNLSNAQREATHRAATAWRSASDDELDALVAALAERSNDELQAALSLVTSVLENALHGLRLRGKLRGPASLTPPARDRISKLYNDLASSPQAAWALLGWLTALRGRQELSLFAELISTRPPGDSRQLPAVLGPLFQRLDYDPAALFPRLLDTLAQKHLAGAVLDLANYLTRQQVLSEHPAGPRREELRALLGAIAQRLQQIEETPDAEDRTAHEVGAMIAESLPLAVSLCDALALIGDKEAIGKLYQAMELKHRRLRTEAAGALARLGEKAGEDILVELAAEPVARLRVLAYAQEVGILDRIDEEYRSDAAQAESRLALWLAQPSQFGIAPTRLELIDQRELYWPSYDDPLACYLFRFEYHLAGGTYANIGISGPLEHAFHADLADLSPDDNDAAVPGWQAEHEEMREYDVAALSEPQRVEVARLERRLRDAGVEPIVPHTLALFFGERVLVASGQREGQTGIAIATSGGETSWFPRGSTSRPLGHAEAYCIFKGRRLLRTFNA